jgi:hypothetical protein
MSDATSARQPNSRRRLYWMFQGIGWSFLVVTLYWLYFSPVYYVPFAIGATTAFLSTFLIHAVARAAWRRKQDRLLYCVLSVGLALTLGVLSGWLGEFYGSLKLEPISQISLHDLVGGSDNYSIPLACWCILYFSIKSYFEVRDKERLVREAKIIAGEAQLKALRSQIRPHFLFNSLNAVSSLVVIGQPDQALRMLEQLKDLFGAMLSSTDDHLTDLATELSHVEQYFAIQKVRYGEHLKYELDITADTRSYAVPQWFLLPIIENSVRYGLFEDGVATPVRLSVKAKKETLVIVSENAKSKDRYFSADGGFGIGLDNTRRLLHVIYGNRASLSIIDNQYSFSLVMELPRVQPGKMAANLPV